MVTVEAAVVLAGFAFVLLLGASAISVVTAQLRCTDAAREAARLVARGDQARAGAAAEQVAPSGARVTVHVSGDTVHVEVTADPVGGLLPGLHLHADASAVLEPTADDPTTPTPR